MGESREPSHRDVIRLMRLCGELGEHAPMSPAWRRHLLEGLLRLIPGKIAFVGEWSDYLPGRRPRPLVMEAHGWLDEDGRRDLEEWTVAADFGAEHPGMAALMATRKRSFVYRRIDQVEDSVWYRSPVVTERFPVSGLDDNMNAVLRLDRDGWAVPWAIYRDRDDRRRFTEREKCLFSLLHQAIVPELRRYAAEVRSRRAMPVRRREVLENLLLGESEKRIARRMNLSPHTIHDHVKALYRHFGVSSRAELMAACLRGNGAGRREDGGEGDGPADAAPNGS